MTDSSSSNSKPTLDECAEAVAAKLIYPGVPEARMLSRELAMNFGHQAGDIMRRAEEIKRLWDAAPDLFNAAHEALNQINIAMPFVLSAPRPQGYAHPADCLKSGAGIIQAAILKSSGGTT